MQTTLDAFVSINKDKPDFEGILDEFFRRSEFSAIFFSNTLIGSRISLPFSYYNNLFESIKQFGKINVVIFSGIIPFFPFNFRGFSKHYVDLLERDVRKKLPNELAERYVSYKGYQFVNKLEDAVYLARLYFNNIPAKEVVFTYSPEDYSTVNGLINHILSNNKNKHYPFSATLDRLKNAKKSGAIQRANYEYQNLVFSNIFSGRYSVVKHINAKLNLNSIIFNLYFSVSQNRTFNYPPSYQKYPLKQAIEIVKNEGEEGNYVFFNSGYFSSTVLFPNKIIILPPYAFDLNELRNARSRGNKSVYAMLGTRFLVDSGVLLFSIDKDNNPKLLHIPSYALSNKDKINSPFKSFGLISDIHIGSQTPASEISGEDALLLVGKAFHEETSKKPFYAFYALILLGDIIHGMQDKPYTLIPIAEKDEIKEEASKLSNLSEKAKFYERALNGYPIFSLDEQIKTAIKYIYYLLENTRTNGPYDLIVVPGNHYANALNKAGNEATVIESIKYSGKYKVLGLDDYNDSIVLENGTKLILLHTTGYRGGVDAPTAPLLYLRNTGQNGIILTGDSHEYGFSAAVFGGKQSYSVKVSALQYYTSFEKHIIAKTHTVRGAGILHISENNSVLLKLLLLDNLVKTYSQS
ncbi:MAG: hypothetical protein QXV66_01820 [Candidatus Rehaiarchaeum fermentans]|nr:hypothetical protein [Candidatus Rehaiarchaeum fermentans]